MSHGWGRDLWRPPWSGVGPPSKHLHIKANPREGIPGGPSHPTLMPQKTTFPGLPRAAGK